MSIYYIILEFLPIAEKLFGWLSIFFFVVWIFQMKSKSYQLYLQNKAKIKIYKMEQEIQKHNFYNQNHGVQLTTSWIQYNKYLLAKRNNTLLLALVLAYLSFNSTSFYENNNDDFYKLLTISTTLFLAGITYIRQQYRE